MEKRNMILGLLAVVSAGLLSFTVATTADTYTANAKESKLVWKGFKVGGQHEGTLALKSGSFTVDNGLITAGSFEIDMTTLKVTDSESKKLYNHLVSKDFFDTESHKAAKLEITGSTKNEAGDLDVTGNLTIKGVTNPISFEAKNSAKTTNVVIYTAKIEVDRTKYGITYKSSAVGDAFINDEFALVVSITGLKNK
ncbi:MAG: polyisoprenoid-binding protein YceI [Bacteroidia bacterium]|jgi:polyisoprenoid-binding protein YceI